MFVTVAKIVDFLPEILFNFSGSHLSSIISNQYKYHTTLHKTQNQMTRRLISPETSMSLIAGNVRYISYFPG